VHKIIDFHVVSLVSDLAAMFFFFVFFLFSPPSASSQRRGCHITFPLDSIFRCIYCWSIAGPSYFCGICTPLNEVGGRVRLRSAHRGDLCVPSTRTEFGKRSFRVAALRTWNSLPLHLRSPTISRQQFQPGLKTNLFKRAYI